MSLRTLEGLSDSLNCSLNFSLTNFPNKINLGSNPPKKNLSNVPNLDTEVNPFNKSKGKNLSSSRAVKSLNFSQTMKFKINVNDFRGVLVNPIGQENTLQTYIQCMNYSKYNTNGRKFFDTTNFIMNLINWIPCFGRFRYPYPELVKYKLKLRIESDYDLVVYLQLIKVLVWLDNPIFTAPIQVQKKYLRKLKDVLHLEACNFPNITDAVSNLDSDYYWIYADEWVGNIKTPKLTKIELEHKLEKYHSKYVSMTQPLDWEKTKSSYMRSFEYRVDFYKFILSKDDNPAPFFFYLQLQDSRKDPIFEDPKHLAALRRHAKPQVLYYTRNVNRSRVQFSQVHSCVTTRIAHQIVDHVLPETPIDFSPQMRKSFLIKIKEANNKLDKPIYTSFQHYPKFSKTYMEEAINENCLTFRRFFPLIHLDTKTYLRIVKGFHCTEQPKDLRAEFAARGLRLWSDESDDEPMIVEPQAFGLSNPLKVGLDNDTQQTINNLTHTLNNLTLSPSPSIDKLATLVSNYMEPSHDSNITQKLVLILGNLFNIIKTNDNAIIASSSIQLAYLIYPTNSDIVRTALAPLLAYLPKIVNPYTVIPQSDVPPEVELQKVRTSIIHTIYYFIKSTLGFSGENPHTARQMASLLKSYDVGLTSIRSILEYAIGVFHYISDLMGYSVDSTYSLSVHARGLLSDIQQWASDATQLVNVQLVTILNSSALSQQYERIKVAGDAILKRLSGTYVPHVHLQSFYKLYDQMKTRAEAVFKNKIGEEIRDEPVGIWLHGLTNVGKSTVIYFIMQAICIRKGIRFHHRLRYERKTGTNYWDAYHNQMFVTFDDIFQCDLAQLNAPAALDVLFALNCNTFPLEMAPLEEKGTTFFTSPYVILTSNTPHVPTTASMTSHAAFYRRFRNNFDVKLKNPNMTLANAELADYRNNWLFTLYDMEGNKTEESFSFDQFIDRIMEEQPHNCKNIINRLVQESEEAYLLRKLEDESILNAAYVVEPQFNEETLMKTFKEVIHLPEWKKYTKIATAIGAFASSALMFWKFFKGWFKTDKEPNTLRRYNPAYHHAIVGESGDPRTSHQPRMPISLQTCTNVNNLQVIRNILPGNMFKVTSGTGGTVTGVFLKGRTFITVAHVLLNSKQTDVILIEFLNKRQYKFMFSECKMVKVPDMDLIFVTCPINVPSCRDISHHFCKMKDYSTAMMDEVKLLLHSENSVCISDIQPGFARQDIKYEDHKILTKKALVFRGETLPGDCGSLYCSMAKNSPIIFGLHTAADRFNNIFAIPVCQELIDKYCVDIVPVQSVYAQCVQRKTYMVPPQGTEKLGSMTARNRHYTPGTSTIRKSTLHGLISLPCTAPAILRTIDGKSPLQLAINKNVKPNVWIDPKILQQATTYIICNLGRPIKDRRLIFSTSQAINGHLKFDYTKAIELKTSAGFPYVKEKSGKGKTHLFSIQDGFLVPVNILQQRIESRLAAYEQGICPPTIWLDNLKDERRSLEKVAQLNTRTFVCPPVDFTIVSRQYLQAFVDYVMEKHLFFDCSVGINPHSQEWKILYTRLRGVSNEEPYWIAGDFSAFDSSIPAQVGWAIKDLIQQWYGDSNSRVRDSIFTDVIYAVHCAYDALYRVDKGNPSGMPLTSIFNSFANLILLRCCWVMITNMLQTSITASDFDKFVRVAVFGDDNVIAVHPHCASFFNMTSISKAMTVLGMQFTDSNKKVSNRDFVPFNEITFLKRSFRKENDLVFAPLEEKSILEMINWVRNTAPVDEATRTNCENAIREYFHYGKETFLNKRNLINDKLAEMGISPIYMDYDLLYREFCDMGINPSVKTLNYPNDYHAPFKENLSPLRS